MIKLSLSELAKMLGTECLDNKTTFVGLSTDTRTLVAHNLFIAIRGENFNGHQFIAEAEKKGASAAIISEPVQTHLPCVTVNDTLAALGKIAAAWRDRFSLPLIGVTGSNGKTTLKNMLASICRAACHNQANQVLATEGNLNNNIGLPLMLARLNNHHRYAVIEMGMNHFGEINYLTHLAKPTIAIINNAAEAHLEGVKDVAGVARAKGEIFAGLDPNGIAVLNRDDTYFDYWRGLIERRHFVTFGLDRPADVTADIKEGQRISIKTPCGEITLTLPLLGRHNVMNALAATATALAAKIDLNAIKFGLENVKPTPGRMRQYTLPNNVKVIDDSYNANPFSLRAAVNTLASYSGKKILVLGDMKELGAEAKQLHAAAGKNIRAAGIDYLFTFGKLSALCSENFGEHAEHFSADEREKLCAALMPHLTNDTTVLIKGSRSMQMEKIVGSLIPAEQLEHTH